MTITLNGQSRQVSAATVADLVQQFCAHPRAVITECNGTIIPPAQRAATPVRDGDRIELVAFVGGG